MFAPIQREQGKVLSLTGRLTTMQIVGPPAAYVASGAFILGFTLPVLPTCATHFKGGGGVPEAENKPPILENNFEGVAPPQQRRLNLRGAPH